MPAVRSGALVHVAGQVPMLAGRVVTTGRVGAEVTHAEAAELSRRCALAALAAMDAVAGLDSLARVVRVAGYVASAPGFDGQLEVVSAAGDLFVALLGAAGRGVCTAVGVPELPLQAPVEIEVTLALSN